MKKKIIMAITCLITILICSGCFDKEKIENINITTTIYPAEYLVNKLYGENSKISTIYPNDTDVNEHTLSDKKMKEYAKNSNIFVYNGLTNEKEIAKTLINKNKKIDLIDISYGLPYKYGIEELWLNPNNYLMLANTIKKDLEEIINSKYATVKIEENYNQLIEELTSLDAELRNIAEAAIKDGNNTIVIAYDSLGFLEKYGFNIINISNENNISTSIKNKFKNKTYTKIFVADKNKISDSIKDIVDNYNVELVEIDMMNTLTEEQRNNKETYLTIMQDFFTNLSNAVLK
ncbi:MAG TPA: hypothetical protein DCE23_06780 [Firmicutes bacterium]|nr:hypothetical protein [Bacillota bacterium]